MTSRPAIPIEIRREVLFEARHRCAVCCEPTPLERAHIDPWSNSKDHSAANLIALCANCHTRADKEKWGDKYLGRYKKSPCALASNAPPIVSAQQQAIIDMVISSDPDSMTGMQRIRFVSMVAAYAGAQIGDIQLLSVSQANSSRIRLSMPKSVAAKILTGFGRRDPLLNAFLEEFSLVTVEAETPMEGPVFRARTTDTSEKGLELSTPAEKSPKYRTKIPLPPAGGG